jgi:hypothetical protein
LVSHTRRDSDTINTEKKGGGGEERDLKEKEKTLEKGHYQKSYKKINK